MNKATKNSGYEIIVAAGQNKALPAAEMQQTDDHTIFVSDSCNRIAGRDLK